MSGKGPKLRLRVLGSEEEADVWTLFVSDVAVFTGLDPLVESGPEPGGAVERGEGLLEYAAGTSDPVLVLPPTQERPPGPSGPAAGPLRRMLVPIDRSFAEHLVLRHWIDRAQARGVEVEQLHVLTHSSMPVMWEGPGHHAEAWRAELHRRHRVGHAKLSVRRGDPVESIAVAARNADLLVVYWRGDVASGKAQVLRGMLRDARTPLLLVRTYPPSPKPR